MSQLQIETEIPESHEVNSVDGSLKSLWDKIRSVIEIVNQLRTENSSLLERNEQLTSELQRTTTQFESQLASLHSQHDREVNSLKAQHESAASSLKKYYEQELVKVRTVGEEEIHSTRTTLETTLRDTKVQLESEVNTLKNQMSVKEQDMKRLRAEYSQLVDANENVAFTKEEKEILRNRIRDLIAKINSHL
ncbi:MAG: hypothetical protein EPO24_02530 [Bacteroidetes bacterium]|nr:MAG: hypothetical protein EPO24_02530 [Bacteroidota bacterium]